MLMKPRMQSREAHTSYTPVTEEKCSGVNWDWKWDILANTVIADTLLFEAGTQLQDHSWTPGDEFTSKAWQNK